MLSEKALIAEQQKQQSNEMYALKAQVGPGHHRRHQLDESGCLPVLRLSALRLQVTVNLTRAKAASGPDLQSLSAKREGIGVIIFRKSTDKPVLKKHCTDVLNITP